MLKIIVAFWLFVGLFILSWITGYGIRKVAKIDKNAPFPDTLLGFAALFCSGGIFAFMWAIADKLIE